MADYLCRMDVIVLDELGYLLFAQSGGQLLFRVAGAIVQPERACWVDGRRIMDFGAPRRKRQSDSRLGNHEPTCSPLPIVDL
jgi:hypothetical protein